MATKNFDPWHKTLIEGKVCTYSLFLHKSNYADGKSNFFQQFHIRLDILYGTFTIQCMILNFDCESTCIKSALDAKLKLKFFLRHYL